VKGLSLLTNIFIPVFNFLYTRLLRNFSLNNIMSLIPSTFEERAGVRGKSSVILFPLICLFLIVSAAFVPDINAGDKSALSNPTLEKGGRGIFQ